MTVAAADSGRAKVLRAFTSDWGEPQEEVSCLMCGSTDAELVIESNDVLYGKPGRYRVVRCRACALA